MSVNRIRELTASSIGRGVLMLLAALAALAVALMVPMLGRFTMGFGMGPGMMLGFGGPESAGVLRHWGWGMGMAFGWLVMIVLWAGVFAGALLLVGWIAGPDDGHAGDPAVEMARKRYAAGEMNREEYEEARQTLQG